MALKLKEKPSKKILGDKMAALVEAARAIVETGSVISNVIFIKGGYKNRYGTYYLNVGKISEITRHRYNVKVGENYVDYIMDENGEYVVVGKRRIRFPLPYIGPVLIVPTDYGFRVYLLK